MDDIDDRHDDDTRPSDATARCPTPDTTPDVPPPCCRAEGFQHWSLQGLPASTGWCF